MSPRGLAVIGGGLAGLSVAVMRAQAGGAVHIFEGSPRFGGQLQTEQHAGFVVEQGAEGFVARSEAVPRLARSLGIEGELVDQSVHRSFAWDGQALAELSPGEAARLLGFQVPVEELGKGIRSFRWGMEQLARALVARLRSPELASRVELVTNAPVRSVRKSSGGVRLVFEPDARSAEFDQVVIATHAAGAARLLDAELGGVSAALAGSRTLSSVTVSLAFESDGVRYPNEGSGFIVLPEACEQAFRACSFSSCKLPNRAPPGKHLLRVFLRPDEHQLQAVGDAELASMAQSCLERALGQRIDPLWSWVSRWANALPVFDPPHTAHVAALEEALLSEFGHARVLLSGAAFHGSGIDAAVRSAERVARALA
ncbi:MAG TPA: FAD-dependent oxidoreductase [Polyangiaceae bacterium]|nr:FAD-dependent oxidoreductase [Polyangiaceae bacterium]